MFKAWCVVYVHNIYVIPLCFDDELQLLCINSQNDVTILFFEPAVHVQIYIIIYICTYVLVA